jgi:hypothetical protein
MDHLVVRFVAGALCLATAQKLRIDCLALAYHHILIITTGRTAMLHQGQHHKRIDSKDDRTVASPAKPPHRRRTTPWLRSMVAAVLILFSTAMLFAVYPQAFAQQSPTLRCTLGQSSVVVGGKVSLSLAAVDVPNLYGYELSLKFNSAVVTFEDADPNRSGTNLLMGDFLSPDFVVLNTVNAATGKANLAVTQLSPSQPVTGTGVLASANLVATSPGTVNFSFEDVVLSDPAGLAIPVTLTGCQLNVTAAQSTATATSTPTATSTSVSTSVPTATATTTGTPSTPVPTATPTATRVPGEGGFVEGAVFEDINANGIREPFEPGVYALVKLYQVGRGAMGFHDAVLTDLDDGTYLFSDLPDGRYVVEVTPMNQTEYVYTTLATVDIRIVGATGFSGANFGLFFNDSGWWIYLPSIRADDSGTRMAPSPVDVAAKVRMWASDF